jgi:hypothetical protein
MYIQERERKKERKKERKTRTGACGQLEVHLIPSSKALITISMECESSSDAHRKGTEHRFFLSREQCKTKHVGTIIIITIIISSSSSNNNTISISITILGFRVSRRNQQKSSNKRYVMGMYIQEREEREHVR